MTDPSKTPSGGDPIPSGTGDNGDPNPPNDIKAVLAKNAELLAEKRKLADKLAELDKQAKKTQEKELAEKERFKELAEQREKELQETQSKLGQLNNQIVDARKFAAFQKELGGAIPEKYHALVDIDRIVYDETSGVDQQSLKDYAAKFREDYSDIVKKPESKLPNDYPKGGGSSVPSIEEWKAMAKSDPKKHRELLPEVFAKYGDQLGR
jgi:hypothetical protein